MQNPNQMFSFPLIFDEAAFALRNRGVKENEIKETVYETLSVCGIYEFRNWPISALSFGQKKRLAIASILVAGPRLLLLDEPTAGQDFFHYSEIMEFISKLNRERNLTFLIITHDMHLMLEYTMRAFVLADGELLANSLSPSEVLTNETLIEGASLKRTSLYDLALKAGLAAPQAFVSRFIEYERNLRQAGAEKPTSDRLLGSGSA
jgi:energy-coupling factor transport system ATP-binding protein